MTRNQVALTLETTAARLYYLERVGYLPRIEEVGPDAYMARARLWLAGRAGGMTPKAIRMATQGGTMNVVQVEVEDAGLRMKRMAEELREKNPKLTVRESLVKVSEADPVLYLAASRGGRVLLSATSPAKESDVIL